MKYRKTGMIEATRWVPGTNMERVSVSPADRDAGHPKDGDMIAHSPDNPDDQWLISTEYFVANYEPAD